MSEMLYRKVEKDGVVSFEPVGPDFAGFPADGVWVVETTKEWKEYIRIERTGDLPTPVSLAALYRNLTCLTRAIEESSWGTVLGEFRFLYSAACRYLDGHPGGASHLRETVERMKGSSYNLPSSHEVARATFAKMTELHLESLADGLDKCEPLLGAITSVDVNLKALECKIVPKSWGREVWVVNNNHYCGKLLVIEAGHACSFHYHKVKHETFFVLAGRPRMRLLPMPAYENMLACKYTPEQIRDACPATGLKPGNVQVIEQGMIHQLVAQDETAVIAEFSTHHEDSDSIRLAPGW